MIAIPLETDSSTTLSKLFGNAPYFALMDLDSGSFKVVENIEVGNGPKTAELLAKRGATSTLFYHMGEGVFNAFYDLNVDVYTSKKTFLTLDEIYRKFLAKGFQIVSKESASSLLDPGDGGNCTCGCSH